MERFILTEIVNCTVLQLVDVCHSWVKLITFPTNYIFVLPVCLGVLLNILSSTFQIQPLVPVHQFDKLPSYYIFAGLVFVTLTQPYLHEYGEDWYNTSPRRLCERALRELPKKANQQLVILSQVNIFLTLVNILYSWCLPFLCLLCVITDLQLVTAKIGHRSSMHYVFHDGLFVFFSFFEEDYHLHTCLVPLVFW